MTDMFTLIVPQWQGSSIGTGHYHGAHALARMLGASGPSACVDVSENSPKELSEGIWYRQAIEDNLRQALAILDREQPVKVLTIGGDCGSDVASLSYLNRRYKGDVTVLWLDAHADLHTPDSSSSGNFHGMPLRLLLGEGDAGLLELLPSTLEVGQIVYTGVRDLDHAERQFIVRNGIPIVPMCHECGDMLGQIVSRTGRSRLYLHLDLDVIDPRDFDAVACPSPGGFRLDDLTNAIHQLGSGFEVIGAAITEYHPKEEAGAAVAGHLATLLRSTLEH